MLTQNARVVNVSSRSGLLKILQSDALRQRANGVKTLPEVDALADEFVDAIKNDRYELSVWSSRRDSPPLKLETHTAIIIIIIRCV